MWSFIVTDLQGVQIGEVGNASARKLDLPLMNTPSASFTIPLYHNLANTILTNECLVKVYRKDPNTGANTLAFNGPVVSIEESGDAIQQTIVVNAAGPFWRLGKRLIPGSTSRTVGLVFTGDLGSIAQTIVTSCNAIGFTGIWPGSLTASINGTADYGTGSFKVAATAIAELAQGVSSFEYDIQPTEPVNRAAAFPQIGLLNCAPTIGSTKPDVIFEYGTSKANIATYSHQVTRDGLLTRAYISVSGWPDSMNLDPTTHNPVHDLIQRDATTEIGTRGLFEEVVDDGGVTDDTLRTQIADYHLSIRKQPREIVTFVPVLNARPSPFTDYNIGDLIRARAVVSGNVRFDANFRVYGINFDIDDQGNETVTLTLVLP